MKSDSHNSHLGGGGTHFNGRAMKKLSQNRFHLKEYAQTFICSIFAPRLKPTILVHLASCVLSWNLERNMLLMDFSMVKKGFTVIPDH